MAKRPAPEVDQNPLAGDRELKRQRIKRPAEHGDPTHKESVPVPPAVISARQLQDALFFDQGAVVAFRSGLAMLKAFLDSILYCKDQDTLPRSRAILREYLDTQKRSGQEQGDVILLPQFIQAWDFGGETNFDALVSQVTSVLALLLRVLSTDVGFREFGNLLCKTVLRHATARRFNRSLGAPPAKANVISPALRLLTEITTFNEGAHAKAVYAKRDFTLEPKILSRNLGLGKDHTEEKVTDHRKSTVRTQAVKYLLAHLRYQDEIAKVDILSHWSIIKAVFEHLSSDPPFLVVETFTVLRDHFFQDKTIPRLAKHRFWSGKVLSYIAGVYKYRVTEDGLSGVQKSPDVAAHEFLMMVCTSPEMGLLLPSQGFYPLSGDGEETDMANTDVEFRWDLYFDFGAGSDKHARVRNVILADFIQTLRPHASVLQQELLLAVLNASPELVANYFVKKEAFSYDPKLTSTWIGYSAFLYQAISLPVPQFFGRQRGWSSLPPAVVVLIQSILPQPLTQQVLTRCLNHSSDLINLFALRILIAAFAKLRLVLAELKAASRSSMWDEAARRLIADFSQRCPPMKAVVMAFRQVSPQQLIKREAILRLLRLYHEVIPRVALVERFDVSIPLCNALAEVEKLAQSADDKSLHISELEHCMEIAKYSPGMRWWQKTKPLQHSPFVTLLGLVASFRTNPTHASIRPILMAIHRDQDLLQTQTNPSALDALIASVEESCDTQGTSPQVLEFLDWCCTRFLKAPIKYYDDMSALRSQNASTEAMGPLSPLLLTLVEQWRFKGGNESKEQSALPLAHWLSKLLYLLEYVGEDRAMLELIRDAFVSAAHPSYHAVLKDAFHWKLCKEKAKDTLKVLSGRKNSQTTMEEVQSPTPLTVKTTVTVDLELPPAEDTKHTALNKWRTRDVEENVEEGNIGELILCLCSEYREIRLQALINLRQLFATLPISENGEWLQLKLLLGEAVETASSIVEPTRLPFVGGVFAAHAVRVVTDPTHFIFAKISEFLMKAPVWIVEDLPRYLVAKILRDEPQQPETAHKEVEWLLDYLIDCLRTSEDMEIFRVRNVFERLLTYYVSSVCSISVKEKIVRLLFRAAAVGGSTTLITRCGILSWIQTRVANRDHRREALRRLSSRLYETCGKERVEEWSAGRVISMISKLEGTTI